MIWGSSYHQRIAQLADFSTAYISFIAAYLVFISLHIIAPSAYPQKFEIKDSYIIIAFVLSFVYKLLFDSLKAYNYQRFTSLFKECIIVVKVCFLGTLISIAAIFLLGFKEVPRTIFVVFFTVSIILFTTEKTLLFYAANYIRRKGRNRKRIILLGTGTRARNFIRTVESNFHWGLDIVGLLTGDWETVGREIEGIKVLDHYSNIQNVMKTLNPEEIIITVSTKRFDQIRDILEICETEGVVIRLNSDFFGHIAKDVTIDNVFGLNIISFNFVRQNEFELFIKRIIDVIGSLILIIIFSPFILVGIFGILISDGLPVFYKYPVIGLNRKMIWVKKIRTMIKNAEKMKNKLESKNEMVGPVFKIRKDPRILPFGHILRKFSIDETPQLFSVLKGDLSLVGPRAPGPHEFEKFESWHRRKTSIKPGLTCLWQVNGRSRITDFNEWMKLDLEYIDNWSLWLDIKILIKTLPVVLLGKGF